MDNANLNSYYNEKVTPEKERTKSMREYCMPIIDEMMEDVATEDGRFKNDLIPVGSYYQGLKVGRSDELDFNVPLNYITSDRPCKTWSWTKAAAYYGFKQEVDNDDITLRQDLELVRKPTPLQVPGRDYTFVRTPNSTNHNVSYESLSFQGDLIPYLVKRQLKTLLEEAIDANSKQDSIRLCPTAHGPALTITITVPIKDGAKRLKQEVSVDFAPILRNQHRFEDMGITWPLRDWPRRDLQKSVKEKGINLVARKNFFWKLSFAEPEKELCKHIDDPGECRKKVHRLMKSFLDKFWCPSGKSELSTYALKNSWLMYCEGNPETEKWQEAKLRYRLRGCIEWLLVGIRTQNIPQYFFREINLLAGKDRDQLTKLNQIASNMEEFLTNPGDFF